ncbi:extracellular solute-binding protein [Paenibacillus piri]|nr:extracellular solute-binding protein [Paenibacillus piri]
MLKRVLSVILLLTVFLTGCSANGSGSNASDKQGSGKPTTIKFWYPASDDLVITEVKKVVAKFEQENPTIKVELTTIPFKDYTQKLSIAYSGGIAPDVHGLGFGQLISTVDQNKYINMSKFIEADQWQGKDDIFPNILKAGQWNGGQYGLLMPEIRPMEWRKDFFKEAGLDTEKPPATLEELFDYAEKLKVVKDQKTVRAGIDLSVTNGEQAYLSLLLLLGKDIYDENGNPTFDSPESIQLVEKMVKLFKDGAVINSDGLDPNGTPFRNSLAAIGFSSSPSLAILQKGVGADKIGWSLPPKGPNGTRTSLMLGTFMTMSKSTKYADESWKFIKFWYDKDNLYNFSLVTGYVPPFKSVKDQYVKVAPENEVIFQAMEDARGYSPSKYWDVNVKYLRLALEQSYTGFKPVDQALKENAQKARDEIKTK